MKKILITLAAMFSMLLPFAASAQVFGQNQIIIPPFGSGVIVSTSTANGAKLQASSSPTVNSINAISTTATSSLPHTMISQLQIDNLTGILKAASGYVQTALVSLTGDVSGILPAANGGTGVGTLTGIAKGNGTGVFTVAINGTDYTLITANTCSAGNHVSAITAAGVITCTPDSGGSGSGTISTSTPLVSGQVDFSTGVNTIGNSSNFTFNNSTNLLTVTGNASTTQLSSSNKTYLATGGGYVDIGSSTTSPVALDVTSPSLANTSGIILRESTGSGGMSLSAASGFSGFNLGGYATSGNWVAMNSEAYLFYKVPGTGFTIYGDAGLTPGSIYTPTPRVTVGSTGEMTLLTGGLTISNLATPAGAFLAVNGAGKLIATTTPSGSFTNTLANGGTATTTFYNKGVVFSDGTKLTQAAGSGASILNWDNTNGRLGIGTTTPFQTLSVNGNGFINGPSFHVGSILGTYGPGLCTNAAAVCSDLVGNDNTTAGVSQVIQNTNGGGNAYGDLVLFNDNPNSLANFGALIFQSHGYNSTAFGTAFSSPDQLILQNTVGELSLAATGTNQPVTIIAGGAATSNKVATFAASGNVGIGTTTPQSKLAVNTATNTASALAVTNSVGSSTLRVGTLDSGTDTFGVASSSGQNEFGVDNAGHNWTGGLTPIISTCGAGTPTITGDDNSGTITVGTGLTTACTMTFNKTWTQTPTCSATVDTTGISGFVNAISQTAVTFGIANADASGKIYYQCTYHHT